MEEMQMQAAYMQAGMPEAPFGAPQEAPAASQAEPSAFAAEEAPAQAVQEDAPDFLQEAAPAPAQEEASKEASVLRQNVPAEPEPAAPAPEAAVLAVEIPPVKAKPKLSSATLRLDPEAKRRLQSMAAARGMALSEFCRAILESVAGRATA